MAPNPNVSTVTPTTPVPTTNDISSFLPEALVSGSFGVSTFKSEPVDVSVPHYNDLSPCGPGSITKPASTGNNSTCCKLDPTNTPVPTGKNFTPCKPGPVEVSVPHYSDISSYETLPDNTKAPNVGDIKNCKPNLVEPSVPHYSDISSHGSDPAKTILSHNGQVTSFVPDADRRPSQTKLEHVVVLDFDAVYDHTGRFEVFEHLPVVPISQLGKGASGKVYLAQSALTSEYFAAKTFLFNSPDRNRNTAKWNTFRREISVLQDLHHENIIKMIYPVTGPSYGVLFLEFCPGGDFYRHLRTLTGGLVCKYFCQIMSAVGYMHSLRIVHRDIKLGNILVTGDRAVLSDFGLSQKLSPESNLVHGRVGTHAFMAPEVKAAKGPFPIYYDGLKADSFALGVFLWCLLKRTVPICDPDFLSSLKRDLDLGLSYDPTLLECSRRLLTVNPEKRWYVNDLMKSLTVPISDVKV